MKIVDIGQLDFVNIEVTEELNSMIDLYSQEFNMENLMVINLKIDISSHLKSGNGASNFSTIFAYGDLIRLIE